MFFGEINRQEDSHEFICRFLEEMDKEKNNKTPTNPFIGKILNRVECKNCLGLTEKEEEFSSISLDLNNKNYKCLVDCITGYFSPESIVITDKELCQKCKNCEGVKKSQVISSYPDTVLFHLKRFNNSNMKLENVLNINSKVNLPGIGVCPVGEEYRLRSIICHNGNSRNGHYFTFIKFNSTWHKMDDARCSEISQNEVDVKEAYILLYERCQSTSISYAEKIACPCKIPNRPIYAKKPMQPLLSKREKDCKEGERRY